MEESCTEPDPIINSSVSDGLNSQKILKLSLYPLDLGSLEQLVISCVVQSNLAASAMIDCGATSQFMDEEFARKNGFEIRVKRYPERLELADGKETQAGLITHDAVVTLRIDQHEEKLVFQLTRLGHYPMILGKSWLARHNPVINWRLNTITFNDPWCQHHCLPARVDKGDNASYPPADAPATVGGIPSGSHHLALVCAATYVKHAKDKTNQCFALSVRQIDAALRVEEVLDNMIPADYQEFTRLFKKPTSLELPPNRPYDHHIELQPGKTPSFGPIYGLSEPELRALREYIQENLARGFIRSSSSAASAPILFVKKKDGSLRLCVDYRALNSITVRDRYPLPLISETLDRLRMAKVYTRLDLREGYHHLRIAEGDEWKTAFRTRYGLFEYKVMPFGLTNAPASFQRFMNDVLREFLDDFCVVYLDDILIYSACLEEHRVHVRRILQTLADNDIHIKPEKCEFHVSRTEFLGFIVSSEGVTMDGKKVEAIVRWEAPRCVRDVQVFLGFANFYRRFIQRYSHVAGPLFDLLKTADKTAGGGSFVWTGDAQAAFDRLKTAFTSAPILQHFNPGLETVVETDASDYVVSGVLSQYHVGERRILHPVAYYSRRMSPAECNYEIHDKELLAIMSCFSEWRRYLIGTQQPFLSLTDHKNLEYFKSTKVLNRRQARWAEKLADYHFDIAYRPGRDGGKPDALTRRSGDLPGEGDERLTHMRRAVLEPSRFLSSSKLILASASLAPSAQSLLAKILSHQYTDPLLSSIHRAIASGKKQHPSISLGDVTIKEGCVYLSGLLLVPDDESVQRIIIERCHDHPAVGHPGRAKTFEIVTRDYWWPSIRKTIARYINNCDTCARAKPVRHMPYGYLKPLEVPQRRWESVSMDFITGLPTGRNGYNAILVVADRLTKMAHFIPTTDTVTAEGLAELYRDHIWRLHGIPDSVVSDRGSLFTSAFWKSLGRLLHTENRLSTAFHPQTDGQTERTNAALEQYLRIYSNYQQDNWVALLSTAEFAFNNTVNATIGMTPFFANYQQHPRWELHLKPSSPGSIVPEVQTYVNRLKDLVEYLRLEIRYQQEAQMEFANKTRKPPPDFQVGDEVWLHRRFINTTRPSNKLDHKKLGRFKIIGKIGTHAYKLALPPSMKVHPVFHVSLLEPVAIDPLPGQRVPTPPPVEVEGELEWEVGEILDTRRRRGKKGQVQYLIRWTGHDHPTWEPGSFLENAPDLVRDFHLRYPRKPRA